MSKKAEANIDVIYTTTSKRWKRSMLCKLFKFEAGSRDPRSRNQFCTMVPIIFYYLLHYICCFAVLCGISSLERCWWTCAFQGWTEMISCVRVAVKIWFWFVLFCSTCANMHGVNSYQMTKGMWLVLTQFFHKLKNIVKFYK